MSSFLLVVCAYLVGSIPFGVIVGRLMGFDPRAVGSGNIGMTNVARAAGRKAAALTFAGDFLKGALPVMTARMMQLDNATVAITAMAALLGAICSIFLGFRGGRGVSTSLGIWLVLAPEAILLGFAVFLVFVAVTRIVSLGSIAGALSFPPIVAALKYERPFILLAIVMAALVLFRHGENLRRIIEGTESRMGDRDGPLTKKSREFRC
jgi:glycerol-3-phosphate acyltransferase PlsY